MKAEVVSTAASAAGVSLVTGTVLGLPLAALVAGFFGGVVALAFMPPVFSAWTRVSSVAVSTLTAAFAAPYVAATFHQVSMDVGVEMLFFAFFTGLGAQPALQAWVPEILAAGKRRIQQLGGGTKP